MIDPERVARDLFGLDGVATALPGEYDLNFRLETGEMHYVHASFTRELEPQKITSYIRSLLWSLGVHNALVTIHSGKQVAHFDYEI